MMVVDIFQLVLVISTDHSMIAANSFRLAFVSILTRQSLAVCCMGEE